MPLQYKIEYRWDDKGAEAKKLKTHSRNGFNRSKSRGLLTERSENPAPRGSERNSILESSRGGKSDGDGKERKKTSPSGLEKVVLPAGYCVYYAPGRGTPLLQSDPYQGRIARSGSKGLGVVNPDSHSVVEEEYTIIREVMEIYLEKQVAEGQEGDMYRVGGQVNQQREILNQLMLALPDTEDTVHNRSDTSPVPDDSQLHPTAALTMAADTSRSLPTTRLSSRCLLPISAALKADVLPRGPFLMEGQAVLDTGRDSYVRYRPQNKPPEVLSRETSDDREDSSEDCDKDRSDNADPSEDLPKDPTHDLHKDHSKEGSFVTEFKPVPTHIIEIKQKGQDPAARYGLICTLNSHEQNPGLNRFRGKSFVSSTPKHRFVPQRTESLLVMSERSSMGDRGKDRVRPTSRIPRTRKSQEAFSATKPNCSVFKELVKGKATGETVQHWKPMTSHRHQTQHTDTSQLRRREETEGHSSVTRMPAKIVLDVVLPRENKSHEDFTLHSRHMVLPGPHPQPLQAWLSAAPSPPPPPPPSAPTNADAGDLFYVLHGDKVEDEDRGTPHHRSGTSCSFPSSASESPSLTAADSPESIVHVAGDENVSSSNGFPHTSVDPGDTSSKAFNSTDTDSSTPTESKRYAHSESNSARTAVSATATTQPSARRPARHAAPADPTPTLPNQPGKAQQTGTCCPQGTRCEVLGPGLCADCEAAQQRRQFSAQQDILYPHISATPRHMVAFHRMKGRQLSKGDSSQGQGWSQKTSAPRWSHVTEGQLNHVVTDLELCKRIVEKGHRAKLPSSYS